MLKTKNPKLNKWAKENVLFVKNLKCVWHINPNADFLNKVREFRFYPKDVLTFSQIVESEGFWGWREQTTGQREVSNFPLKDFNKTGDNEWHLVLDSRVVAKYIEV